MVKHPQKSKEAETMAEVIAKKTLLVLAVLVSAVKLVKDWGL